jgi:hypothetical protein
MNDQRIKELIEWAKQKAKACPKLKEQIEDFLQLAIDEIEGGASVSNEIHLCMSDINELIKENCN